MFSSSVCLFLKLSDAVESKYAAWLEWGYYKYVDKLFTELNLELIASYDSQLLLS